MPAAALWLPTVPRSRALIPDGSQGQLFRASWSAKKTHTSPALPATIVTGISTASCSSYTSRGCDLGGSAKPAGGVCNSGTGGAGGASPWPTTTSSTAPKAIRRTCPMPIGRRRDRRCGGFILASSFQGGMVRSESGAERDAALPVSRDRYDGDRRAMQRRDQHPQRRADDRPTHHVGDEVHAAENPRGADEARHRTANGYHDPRRVRAWVEPSHGHEGGGRDREADGGVAAQERQPRVGAVAIGKRSLISVEIGTWPARRQGHHGRGGGCGQPRLGDDGGVIEARKKPLIHEEQGRGPDADRVETVVRRGLPAGAPITRRRAIERIETSRVAKRCAERRLRASQPRLREHDPDPQDRQIDLGVKLKGRVQGILGARDDRGERGGLGGSLGVLDLLRRRLGRRWRDDRRIYGARGRVIRGVLDGGSLRPRDADRSNPRYDERGANDGGCVHQKFA